MEWEFILTLFLSNGNWMFNKKEKINKDKEKSRGQEEDNSDEKSTDQKDNMNQEECDNQEQKSMKAIGFRKKGDENEKEEYFYLTGKSDYNIMNFINSIFEFDEKLYYFIKQLLEVIIKETNYNNIEDEKEIIDETLEKLILS